MGLHKRNGSCPTSIDQYLLEFDIASLRIGPTSVGDSFLIFKNILERIVWVIPIYNCIRLLWISTACTRISLWLSVLHRAKIGW